MSESAALGSEGRSERESDWQVAHEELVSLARSRAGLDLEEGLWLVAALRGGAHLQLGYGSFGEYVERLFGYGPRLTQDKVRVAEALEGLPTMARALRQGETCWSALRELTRVATPETEGEWLGAAQGKTAREVERLVSGQLPGSRPGDTPAAAAKRHVLRLEVSGEVLATFREAMGKIRRDAGEPLDDDAALLLMARHVLEGPNDEGRASYQVALTVCDSCQRGFQQGRGELVEVGAEVVEMAVCDAQHIGLIPVSNDHAAPSTGAHMGHDSTTTGRGAHVGSNQPVPRATQDIPPAVRRQVLRRDGGRCVFPGCRHATFVDVHHLKLRTEGGDHDPNNLVTLCSAHHRAIHRGHVYIEGSIATGLLFRHADGTAYGRPVATLASSAVDACAKAFRALRGLGFGEGEVRRALQQAAPNPTPDASIELIVRRCLLTLTRRSAAQVG